jgi:hypothetical protein
VSAERRREWSRGDPGTRETKFRVRRVCCSLYAMNDPGLNVSVVRPCEFCSCYRGVSRGRRTTIMSTLVSARAAAGAEK